MTAAEGKIKTAASRAKQGCQISFTTLYDSTKGQIYSYIRKRVKTHELAEELMSKTFIKAFTKIHTYDPGKGKFIQWMFQIAKRNIIDHYWWLNAEIRKDVIIDSYEDVFAPKGGNNNDFLPISNSILMAEKCPQPTPDQIMESREAVEEIKSAIEQTGESFKHAVYVRICKGYSYAEICEELQIKPGTAKAKISRGRAILRTILQNK